MGVREGTGVVASGRLTDYMFGLRRAADFRHLTEIPLIGAAA